MTEAYVRNKPGMASVKDMPLLQDMPVEGYIVIGSKQVEIGTKLLEDSRKYGTENSFTSGTKLSKAALGFSKARAQIEAECENLLKSLGTQVAEPLRAMVVGAPLEEARHLAQHYDRVRQEVDLY